MQEHIVPISSPPRSVAARLKKASLQHSQKFNGTASEHIDSSSVTNQTQLSDVDSNVFRLIGQYLKSRGMHASVQMLIDESGCKLENAAAARFRMHVVNGSWDMVLIVYAATQRLALKVLTDLMALKDFLTRPTDLLRMKFIALEQKYLEMIERNDILEALSVLRTELTPLELDTERVHRLSQFLMVRNFDELRVEAEWSGGDVDGRQAVLERLQSFLPPSVMLPPKRMEVLLRQAWAWQVSLCPLHNFTAGDTFDAPSLLVDHRCKHLGFPTNTRQILHDHVDEVWCAVFSPCGKYLATGAKESAVYIWKVDSKSKTVHKYRTLPGHVCGAAYLSWSFDSKFLAVAGTEDASPDICIWNIERGEMNSRISHNQEDSLSVVAWHKCGRRLVCGGQKGQFYQYDIDGQQPESWEGFRIRGLWCKSDGRTVLASDTHHRIRSYSFDDMQDQTIITETAPLIYFCLDASERLALCTTKGHGLHMWDLDSRSLVKRYMGSKHGDYIIFSCFGGHKQNFIATGSEDNCVYIWHREREDPVRVLRGHSAVVNAVSWNPVDPSMLVSCSDDGTVRVWAPIDDDIDQPMDLC